LLSAAAAFSRHGRSSASEIIALAAGFGPRHSSNIARNRSGGSSRKQEFDMDWLPQFETAWPGGLVNDVPADMMVQRFRRLMRTMRDFAIETNRLERIVP
jgi:hypothetical protein